MSHDALGGQFSDHVKVFRGLEGVTPGEVDHDHLGPHWSYDPEVAYNFAQGTPTGWASDYGPDDDDERRSGTVIAGLVHPDHVVKPGTPEHEGWRDFDGVHDEGSYENEATVRPDAPVHVTAMSHIRYGGGRDLSEDYQKFGEPRPYRA